jgi:hypothetical protein
MSYIPLLAVTVAAAVEALAALAASVARENLRVATGIAVEQITILAAVAAAVGIVLLAVTAEMIMFQDPLVLGLGLLMDNLGRVDTLNHPVALDRAAVAEALMAATGTAVPAMAATVEMAGQ